MINERFYRLPPERQAQILNAAYRVFSQNDYKRAPMSEIAAEGGVSKSLLFHYFGNKQGLYLYLWEHAARLTARAGKLQPAASRDFFDMLRHGLSVKCSLMKQYTHICAFTVKAFYEQTPQIRAAIRDSLTRPAGPGFELALEGTDTSRIRPDIDLKLMYREILWTADGYLHWKCCQGEIRAEEMEREFQQMIAQWEKLYLRREGI